MTDKPVRLFTREYKLAALQRMLAGEAVSALARELGIRRKYLYQWRDRFRSGGPEALRSWGRPTKAEALAIEAHRARSGQEPMPSAGQARFEVPPADALTKAQRRIADLERKVGQQQVELDFFQRALRQVRETRQAVGAVGAPASTRSSKR
jgi:transposase-like protein